MLTQDEAEIYDRQIRLWGVNSQRKIRESRVLMLTFNGVASEVAKILILAGVDTLSIVDNKPLQDEDVTSNLFCRPDHSSKNHAFRTHATVDKLKLLNPLVKVDVKNTSVIDIGLEDLKGYDLVTLHSFLPIEQTSAINDLCRSLSIKFYIVLDFGLYGFALSDLGPTYSFVMEKKSTNNDAQIELERGSTVGEYIAIDDDVVPDDDGIENNLQPSKKKPRLTTGGCTTNLNLSPTRRQGEIKDNEETVSLPFVPFSDFIGLRKESITDRTNPILVLVVALYNFFTKYNRLPETNKNKGEKAQEDYATLDQIILEIVPKQKRDSIFKHIDGNWYSKLNGSYSPVCAVMGGVAGQDMIRALSARDFPIYNTFTFDAWEMDGSIEKVNLGETPMKAKKRPFVIESYDIEDD